MEYRIVSWGLLARLFELVATISFVLKITSHLSEAVTELSIPTSTCLPMQQTSNTKENGGKKPPSTRSTQHPSKTPTVMAWATFLVHHYKPSPPFATLIHLICPRYSFQDSISRLAGSRRSMDITNVSPSFLLHSVEGIV